MRQTPQTQVSRRPDASRFCAKGTTNGHRGFTVLEILVVIGIVGVMSAIIIPSFQRVIFTHQLTSTTEGARATLKKAQSLSSKLNVPVVVEPILGDSPSLRVFADYWDADTNENGSDMAFTSGTRDRLLFEWSIQGENRLPVYFWNIRDTAPDGDKAILGFTDNPTTGQPPLIVFSPPSGRIEQRGMLSLSLASPNGDLVSCKSLTVITLIGQTQVSPCSTEASIFEDEADA